MKITLTNDDAAGAHKPDFLLERNSTSRLPSAGSILGGARRAAPLPWTVRHFNGWTCLFVLVTLLSSLPPHSTRFWPARLSRLVRKKHVRASWPNESASTAAESRLRLFPRGRSAAGDQALSGAGACRCHRWCCRSHAKRTSTPAVERKSAYSNTSPEKWWRWNNFVLHFASGVSKNK